MKICKELKRVFNCYVKSLARIESDCVLSFGFMLLMNSFHRLDSQTLCDISLKL